MAGLHVALFVALNGVFSLLYCFRPDFSENWRIHAKPWPWRQGDAPAATPFTHAATSQQIAVSIGLTLFNVLALALPVSVFSFDGALRKYGFSASAETLPSPLVVAGSILLFMVIEDATFYASHRLLHAVPFLYRNVHKLHHKYYYSLSFAAESSHPVEHLLGNQLPFALGPTLCGAHLYTWYAWLLWRVAETIVNHSGFDVPFSPFRFIPFTGSAVAHDAHHQINSGNYESFFSYLDKLFGTEIPARAIEEYTQHHGITEKGKRA